MITVGMSDNRTIIISLLGFNRYNKQNICNNRIEELKEVRTRIDRRAIRIKQGVGKYG